MSKTKVITTAAIAALASATGMAASIGSASADVTTKWSGGPETREDDRRFHVNGRFMYDVAYTDNDATGVDSIRSYARRAFLGVDGRFSEHWRYNAKFDFGLGSNSTTTVTDSGGDTVTVPNNGTKVGVDDMYLEYAGDSFSFFIGNSNAVSPMEDRDSSLNIPFNERSFLIGAGGFGKSPGLAWLTNGGNWSLGVAFQSTDNLTSADSASSGDEGSFGIVRGTWAPIYQDTPEGLMVLHLGLDLRSRDAGDGSGFKYSPGGLSNKQSNGASVGTFTEDTYIGGEFAFQYHNFGVEAEYGSFDTSGGAEGTADGYYVDLFWSPTGEARSYKASDGSFGSIRPLRPMGADGGIGHIMLAARYEEFDASDSAFSTPYELSAYTLGATWVPIEHVKFQLNYSSTDVDNQFVGGVDNTIDAVTLRTQFDW